MRAARIHDDGSILDADKNFVKAPGFKPLIQPPKGLVKTPAYERLQMLANRTKRKALRLGQAPDSGALRSAAEKGAVPVASLKLSRQFKADPGHVYVGRAVYPNDVPGVLYFVSARAALPGNIKLMRVSEDGKGSWETVSEEAFVSRFMAANMIQQWMIENAFTIIAPVLEGDTAPDMSRVSAQTVVGELQTANDWMMDAMIDPSEVQGADIASQVAELKSALVSCLALTSDATDMASAGYDCFVIKSNAYRVMATVGREMSHAINIMIDSLNGGGSWVPYFRAQEAYLNKVTYWGALMGRAYLWVMSANAASMSSIYTSLTYDLGTEIPKAVERAKAAEAKTTDENEKKLYAFARKQLENAGKNYSDFSRENAKSRAAFAKETGFDEEDIDGAPGYFSALLMANAEDIKGLKSSQRTGITVSNPLGLGNLSSASAMAQIQPPKSTEAVRGAMRAAFAKRWAEIQAMPEANRNQAFENVGKAFDKLKTLVNEYVVSNQEIGEKLTKAYGERIMLGRSELEAEAKRLREAGEHRVARNILRIAGGPTDTLVRAANEIGTRRQLIVNEFPANREKAVGDMFELWLYGLKEIDRSGVDYQKVVEKVAEFMDLMSVDPALMGEVVRRDIREKFTSNKIAEEVDPENKISPESRENQVLDYLDKRSKALELETKNTTEGGGIEEGGAKRNPTAEEIEIRKKKANRLRELKRGMTLAIQGRYGVEINKLFAEAEAAVAQVGQAIEAGGSAPAILVEQMKVKLEEILKQLELYDNDGARKDLEVWKKDPRYQVDQAYTAAVNRYEEQARNLSSKTAAFRKYKDIGNLDTDVLRRLWKEIENAIKEVEPLLTDMQNKRTSFYDVNAQIKSLRLWAKVRANFFKYINLPSVISDALTGKVWRPVIYLINAGVVLTGGALMLAVLSTIFPFGSIAEYVIYKFLPFWDRNRADSQQDEFARQGMPNPRNEISMLHLAGAALVVGAILAPKTVIPGIFKFLGNIFGIGRAIVGGKRGPGRPPKKGNAGPGRPVDVNKAVDELEKARQANNPIGVNKAIDKLKKAKQQGLPVPPGLVGILRRY